MLYVVEDEIPSFRNITLHLRNIWSVGAQKNLYTSVTVGPDESISNKLDTYRLALLKD